MIDLSTSSDIKKLYSHIESSSNLILATFVNPFSYYNISDSMKKDIDYFFSDGILLTKLNNLFYEKKIERISFDSTSLAYPFFRFCDERKLTIALVGAKEDEIDNFHKFIKIKFPNLIINFVSSGYFSHELKVDVIENTLSCDILIVGMGFPFQEEFLLDVKRQYSTSCQLKIAITCGGFFTQHQTRDYYPKFIDRFNLRWLYRLLYTPHVWKKVITQYPSFLIRYIYNAMF